MKIKDILNAIIPMRKLMSLDLTAKDAYKVAKMSMQIDEEIMVFNRLESAAREKYGEDEKQLALELDLILDLDTDKDIKYITIKMPDGKLSAQDILALTPFIAFEEDE